MDLNGNVRGIDFDFKKETGAIIGVVDSSSGGPLTGANVHVSRDKLAFDSQTAVAPTPGSFNIRDLPPGTYLVEFSRYDHAPQSVSVTVGAGQIVDLGHITLEYRPRPPITQNGALEVRVVDSSGNPLNGATVRIVRLSDEAVIATQADGNGSQSSFTFQPLAIGTYRIEVNKGTTYRQSTRRVSIGLGNSSETVPLYRLGQVSGSLVDSFTKEELVDYDIEIVRLNPDGTSTVVQHIPVAAGTLPKPDPDGTPHIRWESNPLSLTSGDYRVDVVNSPPGYRVIPDQVLQPGQPVMRFTISPTDDEPLVLNDILADRFPEIDGVVVKPQLAAGATTFTTLDDDSLAATVTCTVGGTPVTVPASLVGDLVAGSAVGNETFKFDSVELEEAGMGGPCTLSVSAATYVTQNIPVTIEPVRGARTRIDRNVALFHPNTIGGVAFWLDDGVTPANRVIAGGVTVRPQGDVTTGFDPGTVPYTSVGSNPTPRRGVPVTPVVTDAGTGGWAFPDRSCRRPIRLRARRRRSRSSARRPTSSRSRGSTSRRASS